MEAIRQIIRVSKNHEIRVKVPTYILENEAVEMILIVRKRTNNFNRKIKELMNAKKDKSFLDDLMNVSEDYKTT